MFIWLESETLCMPEKTMIELHTETRDRLRAEKVGGETYDDVINRLLKDA